MVGVMITPPLTVALSDMTWTAANLLALTEVESRAVTVDEP